MKRKENAPPKEPLTLDDEKLVFEHRHVPYLALVLGYNELVRQSQSFGERLYYLLHRGHAEDQLVEQGIVSPLKHPGEPILV